MHCPADRLRLAQVPWHQMTDGELRRREQHKPRCVAGPELPQLRGLGVFHLKSKIGRGHSVGLIHDGQIPIHCGELDLNILIST